MKILMKKEIKVEKEGSVLSFENTDTAWNRFLAIKGSKAYKTGNVCGTCNFFFERLFEGIQDEEVVPPIINQLKGNIQELNSVDIQTIADLMPKGNYKVILKEIRPKLVAPGSKDDYFSNEMLKTWPNNGYWEVAHNPNVKYFRGDSIDMGVKGKLFEFVLPTISSYSLNKDTIKEYENSIKKGRIPAVIALSYLDVKEIAVFKGDKEPKYPKHACWTSFIVDGHHKICAANNLKKSVYLLSFIALDHSLTNAEEVDSFFE